MPADRSSTTTVIAISAMAYALADMVHEALGHGLLSLLVPGVKAISISTVALSETGSSRIVAAAGMIANIIVGSVSLWLFANRRQFTRGSYFLWLFAGVNLMNIGYLSYSGILGSGDWDDVIAGLPMEPLWRVVLIAAGIAGYIGVIRLLTAAMASQVRRSSLDGRDIRRVIIVSYLAGSALILVGAAFNPIKQLIWLSRASPSDSPARLPFSPPLDGSSTSGRKERRDRQSASARCGSSSARSSPRCLC